jgi:mono/diheme cytochrome c family protein
MTRKQLVATADAKRRCIGAVLAVVVALGCRTMDESGLTPQGSPAATDLPCDVETVFATRCWACHGRIPTPGLPSLTSVAALAAPSRLDPAQSIAAVAIARMQSTTIPMPPAPAAPSTAADIATVANWIAAGSPSGAGCGSTCTSGRTWTGGGEGSPNMNPGMPCIQCHASDEGPRFSIAGTVYPTIGEPDLCNGAPTSSGVQVMITGADGRTLTLNLNGAGNFFSEIAVARPYHAKVVTAGGERAMTAEQTSGDCNGCHTPSGASGAPGRILIP